MEFDTFLSRLSRFDIFPAHTSCRVGEEEELSSLLIPQVNNCGRPKRRAASISEAATKVMTFFDSPPKPLTAKETLAFGRLWGFEPSANRGSTLSSATKDPLANSNPNSSCSSSSDFNNVTIREKPSKPRRRIAKPSRIPKEVRDVVSELVEVATAVNDLVAVIGDRSEAESDETGSAVNADRGGLTVH